MFYAKLVTYTHKEIHNEKTAFLEEIKFVIGKYFVTFDNKNTTDRRQGGQITQSNSQDENTISSPYSILDTPRVDPGKPADNYTLLEGATKGYC